MRASQRTLLGGLGVLVFVLVASFVWLRFTAPAIEVSGERATLVPDVSGFSGLDLSGSWEVAVQRGTSWRVELDVPAELAERIDVRVLDGVLTLGFDAEPFLVVGRGGRLEARVTMPELATVTVAGASEIDFTGFEGDRLAITSAGAVDIEGHAGRYGALELTMSGAGEADLRDVAVTDAEIALAGAATVTLQMAGGSLTGGVSGAGRVVYYGPVTEQSISASGVASVERGD